MTEPDHFDNDLPPLALIEEAFGDSLAPIPTCGDCTSFPLMWRDRERYCRTIMDYVRFGTPACSEQSSRQRERSTELLLDRISAYSHHLKYVSARFDSICLERRAFDEFREGFPSRLMNSTHDGMVYILRCGKFCKIGFTSEPLERRLNALRTGNPFKLILCAAVLGDIQLEKALHSEMAKWRHQGEWFKFSRHGWQELFRAVKAHGGHVLT